MENRSKRTCPTQFIQAQLYSISVKISVLSISRCFSLCRVMTGRKRQRERERGGKAFSEHCSFWTENCLLRLHRRIGTRSIQLFSLSSIHHWDPSRRIDRSIFLLHFSFLFLSVSLSLLYCHSVCVSSCNFFYFSSDTISVVLIFSVLRRIAISNTRRREKTTDWLAA